MTQRERHRPEGMWQAHPVLSAVLRVVIFTIPIAAALGTTWLVRSLIPSPSDPLGWGIWWGLLLTLGVIVAMAVERVARRLVPLATLLKLSMLFPDRAPSRFRIARKSGNVKHLESLQARADDAGDSATKILTLVTALSNHDRHTRGHAERVRVFTDMLSEELGLPERDRYRLRWAALLHDIGKLTIDPAILNKKSKLNEHEWTLIREHPLEGVRVAGPLVEWLGPWGQAIAHHHERVDGTGYPAGLAGEQISLGGRIVSVADAYDTMTSARSYQKPKATAAARRELVSNAGGQFDAAIVRAFLAISLPRLLWATGPLSLAVHLPFLAQLQQIGQTSIAAAAQTATVTAVAGVTAMGLMSAPAMAKVERPNGRVRTVFVAEA
jgi:HD domain-containing protein